MKKVNLIKDKLKVRIYEESQEMAFAAAEFVAKHLGAAVKKKGLATLIIGTGMSQMDFLQKLLEQEIEWNKVTVFHLDEYLGMPESHPASFRKFLKEVVVEKVKPGKTFYLNGDAADTEVEIARYENLLKEHVIDVACIGIGENGHIAFNDPPVADFNDTRLVKIVELDEVCRNQQLGEGWFPSLDEVPAFAISLTIPAIMRCNVISCVVPESRKANAVFHTLNDPITTACPATILRKHPDAVLFLDAQSSSKLDVQE